MLTVYFRWLTFSVSLWGDHLSFKPLIPSQIVVQLTALSFGTGRSAEGDVIMKDPAPIIYVVYVKMVDPKQLLIRQTEQAGSILSLAGFTWVSWLYNSLWLLEIDLRVCTSYSFSNFSQTLRRRKDGL